MTEPRTDMESLPTSEVGYEGQPAEEDSEGNKQRALENVPPLLHNVEMLLSRLLAAPQPQPAGISASLKQFIRFDPDDPEADIEGWCKITEIVINGRNIQGTELLLALTHALKGRAATFLTRMKDPQVSWPLIKEMLIAKFAKPMSPQDYFDEILRFQLNAKETASEAAVRLWNIIERIPRAEIPEDIMTGFVASVLCQKDSVIRRELHSHNVDSRTQLFRILNGISHKRKCENTDNYESDNKRPRYSDTRFAETCHRCGTPGHRAVDCRKRREDIPSTNRTSGNTLKASNKTCITCFACGEEGHLASACLNRKTDRSGSATVKEVHVCERKPRRSNLITSSVDRGTIGSTESHEDVRKSVWP